MNGFAARVGPPACQKTAANGAGVEVGAIPSAPLKRERHHRVRSIFVCCFVCQWPTCCHSLPFHLARLMCGHAWGRHTPGAGEYLSKVTSLCRHSGRANSTRFKHLDQRGSLRWSKVHLPVKRTLKLLSGFFSCHNNLLVAPKWG